MVDKFAESKRDFDGVQVLSLNIFDEGHFSELEVGGSAHIGGHALQAGFYGGAVASLTRDNLIGVANEFSHRNWLDDADFGNRHSKFVEGFLVKHSARLVGIYLNFVDRDFRYCRCSACGRIVHRYKRIKPRPNALRFEFGLGMGVRGFGAFVFGYYFFGKHNVRCCSATVGIVHQGRQTVAWSLAEANIARNDSVEHHIGKMAFQLFVNLVGKPEAGIVHGEQKSFDFERRVQTALDYADSVEQFADAFEREIFRLDRNQHRVGGGKGIHRNQPERRRAVDKDIIVFIFYGCEQPLRALSPGRVWI